MKKIWALITSYPMICLEQCFFIDKVSGNSVGVYRDRHGCNWLAEGRWSIFRVSKK